MNYDITDTLSLDFCMDRSRMTTQLANSGSFMLLRSVSIAFLSFVINTSGSKSGFFLPNRNARCCNPPVPTTESFNPLGPSGDTACNDLKEKFYM
jgi:hypothetical protein